MFNKICLAVIVLMFTAEIYACGVCGGGANMQGGYFLWPNKSFIGLKYNHQALHSKATELVGEYNYQFNTASIVGGYKPTPRIQLNLVLPYSINIEQSTGRNVTNGLGDVILLGSFDVLSIKDTLHKLNNTLKLGVGVKLPTGRTLNNEDNSPENLSLGTGTSDYMFYANNIFSACNCGIATSVIYKLNSLNKNTYYRFGDRLTSEALLSYHLYLFKGDLFLREGVYYEKVGSDMRRGNYRRGMEGEALFLNSGLQYVKKKIVLGLQHLTPLSQNYANGNFIAHSRVEFNITQLF